MWPTQALTDFAVQGDDTGELVRSLARSLEALTAVGNGADDVGSKGRKGREVETVNRIMHSR
jgi:2-phospho-L-lactate transferase/gluconeogenesis factor (CofD/UPF0052 family)